MSAPVRDFAALNARLNAFTRTIGTGAAGVGALAGLKFAAKDLFDVAGLTTIAGAAIRADAAPAACDAAAVALLRAAGAQLVGMTNMDEFAYGFVTENAHFGTTCNPHDPERLAGGSSGGSAAAVAARMVDFALGSDTNGSIRVPASLCGIYGLRPTHGQVSEAGCYPFVERLDVVGTFARSPGLLRRVHAVLTGHAIAPAPLDALRVGVLTGWFRSGADSDVLGGIAAIAARLGGAHEIDEVELPLAGAARSAAFLITAAEGGARHLAALRTRAMEFDPATRDRLLAGAMVPLAMVRDAEAVADMFIAQVEDALRGCDLLLAPSTPCVAPRIDAATIMVDGEAIPARANLGIHAQPISLAGVPVLSVPLARPGKLPIGVQLIAAKGREDLLFSAAERLEAEGVIHADRPALSLADEPC